ncbi:arylsulfatase I-like isoform X2 [Haemaphysalis longicornis]
MLENCLIVFSSDNGGNSANGASNWPLRGQKKTLWEGGVRLPAFVWSPLLGARGRVSRDLMHFVDWLPTLYHLAGGNVDDLGSIDGVNQWETLSRGAPSKRRELLLGFSVLTNTGAYRSGRYKLVVSPSDGSWDEFREEPPGNVSLAIDLNQLMADSAVAQTLAKFYNTGTPPAAKPEWRQYASVCCGSELGSNFRTADSPYLFDVVSDPCETKNLAGERGDPRLYEDACCEQHWHKPQCQPWGPLRWIQQRTPGVQRSPRRSRCPGRQPGERVPRHHPCPAAARVRPHGYGVSGRCGPPHRRVPQTG